MRMKYGQNEDENEDGMRMKYGQVEDENEDEMNKKMKMKIG